MKMERNMLRKLVIGTFFFIVIGISAFFLSTYKAAAPLKDFLLFIAVVTVFIIVEIVIYKLIKERIADNEIVLKLFNLVSAIALGVVLYLFAHYVYPGR
jgi:uncharacterized membrane protein YiaA